MKNILIAFLLCLSLASCSAIKDTVPVQILASAMGEEIEGFENLAEASSDYIKYCMKSDMSLYSEYIVLYPFAGTEYNEIGIFKVKNESDIDNGKDEIKNYIRFKKENWDTRYNGDEFKKIEDAKLSSYGKYIFYMILEKEEGEAVAKRFFDSLK